MHMPYPGTVVVNTTGGTTTGSLRPTKRTLGS